MSQGSEDIAQQLDEADDLLEHLELDDALRVAESAWRSAERRGSSTALKLSIQGRLLGARVLSHQLRLTGAQRLVEEARALQRRPGADQTEDILYALRLLRCLRSNPRGTSVRGYTGALSRDVPALFAQSGAGLDARVHPLLKLRHHEAVLLSATSSNDLQREGYRALVAARALLSEAHLRQELERSLLDSIETIFWFRFGEMERGRDFVELVYSAEPATPLQQLRRGFVLLTEVNADGFEDDEIEDLAVQFADRCLKSQMRAFALRGLALTQEFGSDAWRTTPLLELII